MLQTPLKEKEKEVSAVTTQDGGANNLLLEVLERDANEATRIVFVASDQLKFARVGVLQAVSLILRHCYQLLLQRKHTSAR